MGKSIQRASAGQHSQKAISYKVPKALAELFLFSCIL